VLINLEIYVQINPEIYQFLLKKKEKYNLKSMSMLEKCGHHRLKG